MFSERVYPPLWYGLSPSFPPQILIIVSYERDTLGTMMMLLLLTVFSNEVLFWFRVMQLNVEYHFPSDPKYFDISK